MRYAVYHAIDPMQMVFHDPAQWQTHRDTAYRHVADVEANSEDNPLSQVFGSTNHSEDEHPWQKKPEVVWHDASRPQRSTSVGDVVINQITGETWMVMPFGWKRLERQP